jgi:hypothetical protein
MCIIPYNNVAPRVPKRPDVGGDKSTNIFEKFGMCNKCAFQPFMHHSYIPAENPIKVDSEDLGPCSECG